MLFEETQADRRGSVEHLLADARIKREASFRARDRTAVDYWDKQITRLWKLAQGKPGVLV